MSAQSQPRAELSARHVRGVVDGHVLVDSLAPRLVYEPGRHPTYWFREQDVAWELLSELPPQQSPRGRRRVWSLALPGRQQDVAVWTYPDAAADHGHVAGLVRVAWGAMDSWYEEDEELFHSPRDPYRRIDALRSSRHVQVRVGGVLVAESRQPVLLFETGLPVRYYLPASHVDSTLLAPSTTTTACQYKGTTRYWHAVLDGVQHDDVAWSYPVTVPTLPAVAGLIAFGGPAVEHVVDGRLVQDPRPAEECAA